MEMRGTLVPRQIGRLGLSGTISCLDVSLSGTRTRTVAREVVRFVSFFKLATRLARSQVAFTAPKQWESALVAAGFINIQTSVDPNGGLLFLFSAQAPFALTEEPLPQSPSTSFFTYKYGNETQLQIDLSHLDANKAHTVWLLADTGEDSDAAAGMVPTLAKEFSFWNIHVGEFPPDVTEETERIHIILKHWDYLLQEQLVRFDTSGTPSVAKVVPSLPPLVRTKEFDPSGTWTTDGLTLIQTILEPLRKLQVVVEVLAWSNQHSSWRGFVGTVTESRFAKLAVGCRIVGVTSAAQISNHIICEGGCLAQVPEADFSTHLANDAVAMMIVSAAIGSARVADTARGSLDWRVLVLDSTELGGTLVKFLEHSSLGVAVQHGMPSEDNEQRFNLIIQDSTAAQAESLGESWLVRGIGKVFVWDDWLQAQAETDPWNIGYSLSAALNLRQSEWLSASESQVIIPLEISKKMRPTVVPEPRLFSGDKSYIILGGASELGLHMSLWMHKVRFAIRLHSIFINSGV